MINFISRKIEHHARHSGYDRLVEFIPDSRVIDNTTLPSMIRRLVDNPPFHSLIWRAAGIRAYGPEAFLTEIAALRLARQVPGQIFHFIYGEDMYRFSGAIKPHARLICTFHQPPARFLDFVPAPTHLKKLDAAIIVGNNQRPMLSPYLAQERIFFVPHGVDTNHFRPAQTGQGHDRALITCITVGQWLRDFETLGRVICQINADGINMRFVVVTSPANFGYFQGCPGVECLAGVNDVALRDLYQAADVLLLPLQDASANNSLLEGMACGLPIVITDVGGVRDYVNEACAIKVQPGDVEGLIAALQTLTANHNSRRQMRHYSRQRALEFDWCQVAGQMAAVYRQVTGFSNEDLDLSPTNQGREYRP